MANIVVVWQSDYPWDVRIDKMVRTLVKSGNSVTVLANNKNACSEKYYLGAVIERLDHQVIPFPLSQTWARKIAEVIERAEADILLVRDLPLFLPAYQAAKRYGIPIWLDMAEDYPATFLDMDRRFHEKLMIKNYYFARIYERFAIHKADVILVVCQESKTRLEKAGISPQKIVIMENFPDAYFLSNHVPRQNQRQPFNLIYTGNFGKKRGLETTIDAIALVRKNYNIHFTIAGGTLNQIRLLKQYIYEKQCECNVTFLGKIDYLDLANAISRTDVGVVPHLNTLHTCTTMPNKIYDYLAVGKPVIVSDVTPLKRVVEENGVGLCFNSGDADSLANCILEFLESPELYNVMKNNARKAYANLRWELQEAKLIDLIERYCMSKTINGRQ